MSDYRGVIIEESLKDPLLMQGIPIEKTVVVTVTEAHETPWLAQWTKHYVCISEDQAKRLAEQLSEAFEQDHPGEWYADFCNDTHHYIIFPGQVFYVDRHDHAQYLAVTKYGISVGIPPHQVNFSRFFL